MASVREWIRRLWGTLHPSRDDRDLEQELQSHLEFAAENARRRTSDDAARIARIAAGGVSQAMDAVRDQRGAPWLDDVQRDVRYALRGLTTNPGFTAVAALTLALGIGVTTAIFSVVYGVLLRPLPYADPDRLIAIFEVNSKGRPVRLADPNFDDFRDQSRSFQAIAKYTLPYPKSVSGASQPTRTTVATVSPDFLRVFRVQPMIGRDFNARDAQKGASPTALVSYDYWRQYLESSRDLSRSYLKIDRTIYSVIGVLPSGFHFPADVDLWLPADLEGESLSRTSHNYSAVARLADGVTVEQANRDISAIARRIHDSSNEQGTYLLADGRVIPLQDSITGTARSTLLILLGAVGFLLLVACANVANLLLAQAAVRERELAVRSALGAGRGRLIRQFVTEAFLLVLIGGSLGVIGAAWGVDGLVALAPSDLPRLDSVGINVPVLAFACLLSTGVAAGLGALTAVRATSGDLRDDLVTGARGQTGSQRSQRIGRFIVATQMAVTLVLVVGAGLLGRSLMKVLEVNPGFRVDPIVSMDVSLPSVDPAAKPGQALFFATLIDRLGTIPGVRMVGAISNLPLNGGHPDGLFALLGPNDRPTTTNDLRALFQQKDRLGSADFCVATDGYFKALAIPLIRGRVFEPRDGADAPHVAVITQALARDRWPNQDPIGRTIEFGNMDGDLRPLTIIGVVGDTHEYGLDAPPRPTVYVNLFQRPRAAMSLTMLSDADTQQVTSAARGILKQLDSEIPATFRTFSQVYAASLGSRRFNVILIGFFGIAALVLAMTGVFGVMAYSVSRRRREIGVRVALGAARGDVLRMILSQGMRTIVIGVAAGIAGALALTRTVESLLFGVTATDPLTFGGVTLLLVSAALLACYLPARRATRVDPMVVLRND
jgi:putative ABC transport system permease protein